ncbi:MAG: endonuclease/exonuclease/phosphatase family protein [Maribacter sp.]|uniref:endonuclease/exonuclease/phosphatase family protein n=1 Tax=Maribacter sp. TaxID=1897614 RepID=UPI003C73FF87
MGKRLGTFNKLVVLLNVFAALLLLLASISRFLNWGILSFLSFLTLLLPHLVLANVFFLVYWGIKGKKQLRLSLSVLLLGFLTQDSFFKIFGSNERSNEDGIKVMTFNVKGLNGLEWAKDPVSEKEIVAFIKQQNADILCMQEFDSRKDRHFDTYKYRYKTLNKDDRSPQAIFSKYPIIAKGSLDFPNSGNNAIYADILIGRDTLRVYNIHLQSFSVRPRSFKREAPDRLFDRLNRSFKKQQQQSNIVSDHASKVAYDKIICGDFNNTQFSSVYYTIKGDMTDSFQEKGFGIGSTYDFKFLPFRIDFILADPSLEIMSHKNFNVRMSDHTPVMASFRLKE